MNEIQGAELIVVLIPIIVVCQAFTLVVIVITPINSNNLQTLGMFTVLQLTSLFYIIFVVGRMAQIYNESRICLMEAKRQLLVTNNKLVQKQMQRFYKSCSTVVVKFGSVNFIDSFTPLRCLQFANSLTSNLLLLSK